MTNALVRPSLVIMNAEMIKEVTSAEKMMIMPKEKGIFEVFFSIVAKGIIAIEGSDWKHRRRLLSKVFNYDFITDHIPMMITIADKVFDEVEANHWKENPEDQKERKFTVGLFDLLVKYTS